jgi:hypothetical protein
MIRTLTAIACVLGAAAPCAGQAAAPVSRAWTLLEQGAADAKLETRVRAVEALGFLVGTDTQSSASAVDYVARSRESVGRTCSEAP